jgi:hypothetical protein
VDNFIENQAAAWQGIVTQMLEEPLNQAMNGGTVNGPGSSLRYTTNLREQLPDLLKKYGIQTVLDAPCGDLTWIKQTRLDFLYSYIGMDVDRRIIDTVRAEMAPWKQATFICTNLLTRKKLPKVDVILSRDFLAHLTNDYLELMINKYRASGSRYLLASNYPGASNNFEYDPEDFPWDGYLERPHDLTTWPYNLTRIDGIPEESAPNGVLINDHELALFQLN